MGPSLPQCSSDIAIFFLYSSDIIVSLCSVDNTYPWAYVIACFLDGFWWTLPLTLWLHGFSSLLFSSSDGIWYLSSSVPLFLLCLYSILGSSMSYDQWASMGNHTCHKNLPSQILPYGHQWQPRLTTVSLISPTITPSVTWAGKVETPSPWRSRCRGGRSQIWVTHEDFTGGVHQGGFLDPQHH